MKHELLKKQVYTIAALSLLIALNIVFGRLFSIRTPIVTIGFGFVPIFIAGALYGPLKGGAVGALGDFLGAVLFPIGPYFPGFTVTAFLTGVVFGVFLHKKSHRWLPVLLAVCIVNLFLNLVVDTYWLYLITGKAFLALLPARVLKCALMIPVQMFFIRLFHQSVGTRLALRQQ